uniref:DNA replication factor RFC1 C-terminal domain-containing protein n=1 Tax=Panagrolaimus sp. JU765 TaxID=591449 RepID=A0AC34Q8H6_9BILA
MVTDYVPLLRDRINRPLIKKDVDGVKEVIEVYKHYDLMREDTEAMEELGLWPGMKDIREKVSTKAKSALTRNLNKEVRLLPYSLTAATKGKKKAVAVEEELDEEGHVVEKVVGANSDDEAENDEKDEDLPDIKIKTETDTKTTTSKRGGGTSRGGRGGRGRGASRK